MNISKRMRRRRHAADRSRGQALVEFALILPVLLLLLVITLDFGRLFFSYIQITNAAREAANYGSHVPTDLVGMQAKAGQETNSQGQRGENATVITAVCKDSATPPNTVLCSAASGGAGSGNTVTVNVNEPFTFLTPLISGFFGGNLTMSSSATSVITDYAPGSAGTPPATCAPPVASFTVVNKIANSVTVNPGASTPNTGTCAISGYNWQWNSADPLDTSVGHATGDDHDYALSGTYFITLQVTNQGGAATTVRSITVPAGAPPPVCAKPIPNFTWTTTGSGSNTVYSYFDASTVADPINCPITDWAWTFTDGGLQSNFKNPTPFTYGNNSNHPVTLIVTNPGGSSSITKDS
jgi:Flp pilus assembly protein TadG